jgi:hypothetical protein
MILAGRLAALLILFVTLSDLAAGGLPCCDDIPQTSGVLTASTHPSAPSQVGERCLCCASFTLTAAPDIVAPGLTDRAPDEETALLPLAAPAAPFHPPRLV